MLAKIWKWLTGKPRVLGPLNSFSVGDDGVTIECECGRKHYLPIKGHWQLGEADQPVEVSASKISIVRPKHGRQGLSPPAMGGYQPDCAEEDAEWDESRYAIEPDRVYKIGKSGFLLEIAIIVVMFAIILLMALIAKK